MKNVSKFNILGEDIFIKDKDARTATEENKKEIAKNNEAIQKEIAKNNEAIQSVNVLNEQNKIIIISDSYGTGQTAEGYVTSYIQQIKNIVGDSYIYSSAVGGAGFTMGTTFLQQLQNLNVPDKDNVKGIYFIGGYNDQPADAGMISTAFDNVKKYVAENYKNASVHIGFCAWSTSPSTLTGLQNVLYWYSSFCGYRNFKFIHGLEYALHDTSLMSSDKIHPNETGHTFLASYFLSYLITGSISVHYYSRQQTVTALNGWSAPYQITQRLDNDVVETKFATTFIENSNGIHLDQCNGDWYTDIFYFNSSLFVGSGTGNSAITVPALIREKDTNRYMTGMALLRFNGVWCRLYPIVLDPNTGAYFNGTFDWIRFGGFSYVCSTISE